MSLQDLPSTYHRLTSIRAEVDLAALRHNVRVLRRRAGEAEILGVVKADAYGHGAVPVTRALVDEGVRRFAVANVPEGIELREAGVSAPILVLGAPLPEHLPAYSRHGLQVAVTSAEVARDVAEAARLAGPLSVHLKVDTGMHRVGVSPDEAVDVARALAAVPGVELEGIMTHFANVDRTFTMQQLGRFDAVLAALGSDAPPRQHVSNSGTLLNIPETTAGRTDARVGGALFGLVSDRVGAASVEGLRLRPVMRLASRVVHLQTLAAGETVSYGRTWAAEAPTRIATVAAGYGDGFPRAVSPGGSVGLRGTMHPIVGRVCMDMLMVDVGPAGQGAAAVSVGDEAVLFGPGGPSAIDVAAAARSIAYAITSGLTARVPRVYVGAGEGNPAEALAAGGAGAGE